MEMSDELIVVNRRVDDKYEALVLRLNKPSAMFTQDKCYELFFIGIDC